MPSLDRVMQRANIGVSVTAEAHHCMQSSPTKTIKINNEKYFITRVTLRKIASNQFNLTGVNVGGSAAESVM